MQYTEAFLRLGKVWVVERAAIVLLTVLVDWQVQNLFEVKNHSFLRNNLSALEKMRFIQLDTSFTAKV